MVYVNHIRDDVNDIGKLACNNVIICHDYTIHVFSYQRYHSGITIFNMTIFNMTIFDMTIFSMTIFDMTIFDMTIFDMTIFDMRNEIS